MALDKLVDSSQLDSDLNSVANAILDKSGGTGPIAFPSGFVSEIQAIPSGGGDPGYGFVDVLYDQADITGGIQNNKLVNLSITAVATKRRFMLKKPIHIVPDDVVTFTFKRTSSTQPSAKAGGYNDFFADCIPAIEFTIKANTGLTLNTEYSWSYTASTTFDIISIRMGGRNGTYWTGMNADMGLYLNGVKLF